MRNQKGVAAVETVLILVIVAILAGTGWYVYKARKNSDKNLSNATSASQSQTASQTPATTPPSATDNQSLQSDLDSINSAQSQASQDNNSAGAAVNDQQSEISVPTN